MNRQVPLPALPGDAAIPPVNVRTGGADGIIDALALLCAGFDLPFSPDLVMARLPVLDDTIDRELFVRAANAAGLDAVLKSIAPSAVPPLIAPFVLFTGERSALIVEKIDLEANEAHLAIPQGGAAAIRRRITLQELDAQANQGLAYVTPMRSHDRETEDRSGLLGRDQLLGAILRAYWPSWSLVVAAAAAINLLALASPLFIMNVYDRVLPNLALPTLWALAFGVALALIFDAALKQARATLLDRTGNRIDMQIGSELFARIMRVRMDAFPSGTGALANTIREAETVREFFTSASLVAATDMLFLGVFILVLWLIAGPLFLVPLAAVVAVLAITWATRRPVARALHESAEEMSRRQTLLVESLSALETLRLAAAEPKRQHGWERAVMASADGASRAKFWTNVASVSTSFILQFVTVAIITWGVFLVIDGTISVGSLIAANLIAARVLQPLSSITQTLARSGQAFGAMRRIQALMRLPVEDEGVNNAATIERGVIEFRNVAFAYPGSQRPALRDVSFIIQPGERVGVIGAVGSGKSTLGRLLAGLYDAQDGSILIDGLDIRQYARPALRTAVSCAGQENQLFGGTLRDNIALGARAPDDGEIAQAAEVAGVMEFAGLLPDGLATRLTERGANLSGGQRQAVALARTLVRKPRILFLDEPTSAMDSARENRFIARLAQWCGRERTLIVATHKTNVLGIVDRLIVMDNGRIVAAGPRDVILAELRRKPGEAAP